MAQDCKNNSEIKGLPCHGEPCAQFWCNPALGSQPAATEPSIISMEDVGAAASRLVRFAPLLTKLFPALQASSGLIESGLVPLKGAYPALAESASHGRYWVKTDSGLPVAGSIKARGGIYEVLAFAETLAERHGLLAGAADYGVLAGAAARACFGRYEISVGSTGNLGLSIGIMASAMGFRVTVHMSAEARQWKKDKLRAHGVTVVEHEGDYARAVAAGRARSLADPQGYFVDDEHSMDLFLGYSVAGLRLRDQLAEAGVTVDAAHPLFVYLPCGVGGAPAGITAGVKLVFGEAAHCVFVEPAASACFMTRLQNPEREGISIYDAGMDNRTEADGLAVPVASELAYAQTRHLISGVVTVQDAVLFADLARVQASDGLKVEPSAAAGFSGPRALVGTVEGQAYLREHGLLAAMPQANHIIWCTGGAFVPAPEYEAFLERGRDYLAAWQRPS